MKILLGVSGSIAAYKAIDVMQKLKGNGHTVTVVQTKTSEKFVGAATFAALSGNDVLLDGSDFAFPHLDVARSSDVLLIAPATATTIARLANGLGDEILSATALGFDKVRILAPAMNMRMWANPAVQRNITLLQQDGWHIISPTEGALACGDVGPGRLAQPDEIVMAVERILAN